MENSKEEKVMKPILWASICVMFSLVFSSSLVSAKTVSEDILSALPIDHPGSQIYPFQFQHKKFRISGRDVDVFLPSGANLNLIKTAVVFGHGQAIGLAGYEQTLIHLARKGIPVIFPQYDKNFMDRDWFGMARAFNEISLLVLARIRPEFEIENLVYSGHSKGAYVALTAASLLSPKKVGAIVLFQPAGVQKTSLEKLSPEIPLSIFVSEKDRVVKKDIPDSIYNLAPSQKKQLIQINSYINEPRLVADHFIILSKSYVFGGKKGTSLYHHFGIWKWLIGAVQDLESGGQINNQYLYGSDALTTGLTGFEHFKVKSNIN